MLRASLTETEKRRTEKTEFGLPNFVFGRFERRRRSETEKCELKTTNLNNAGNLFFPLESSSFRSTAYTIIYIVDAK